MALTIQGGVVVAGEREGDLLVAGEPLSFWGGYDATTGEIIDRRHPLSGRLAGGRILALPGTIGSSTTTAVLLEALRAGTAPAAIITIGTDPFLALASVVAQELYGRPIPIVALTAEQFQNLKSGARASLRIDGTVQVLD